MKTAEDIVRALAANPPRDAKGFCAFDVCPGGGMRAEGHGADCPWRMAREWVGERDRPPAGQEVIHGTCASCGGKYGVTACGVWFQSHQLDCGTKLAPDTPSSTPPDHPLAPDTRSPSQTPDRDSSPSEH